MGTLIKALGIVAAVIVLLLSLPWIVERNAPQLLSDEELRERALSTNMLPVPKTYEELIKVADNPKNPLSLEKIALGKALFLILYSPSTGISAAHHATSSKREAMTICLQR